MTIDIQKYNGLLILNYSPQNDSKWIGEHFDNNEGVIIKRVFHFRESDLYENHEAQYPQYDFGVKFVLGILKNDFYNIPARILNLRNDLLIHKDATITSKYFGCSFKNNIMKQLEQVANCQIVIGGNDENSIPIKAFDALIKSFPTPTEKTHYANNRIYNILSEYIDNIKNYGKIYNQYLERKNKTTRIDNTTASVKNYENEKYSFILERLKNMLEKSDGYIESQWQNEILEIITLMYPKYLFYIPKMRISDTIQQGTPREIDIALLDENGNIDIIEIKTPDKLLLSRGLYRDNYVPSRELAGSIMQLEKYIYHLNRMGMNGEEKLTKRYEKELQKYQFKIHITNPKGIVIAGRSKDWKTKQLTDFEIIKRKYSHIVDIITYDDLIKRLENIIEKFSS